MGAVSADQGDVQYEKEKSHYHNERRSFDDR
ncbi:hypothetical protein C815_00459 [Firmicutes bacterium M10-2]|nr:hypothetical protein C815_00459 [Firmicutes bacterium M10-2]